MSVNSEMTAIADLIRGLRGVSGKMGLDAMKGHLQDEQDGLDSALAALTEKGVTVPDGTKVDGLAALIAAIEAGGGSGPEIANYYVFGGAFTPSEDVSSNLVLATTESLGLPIGYINDRKKNLFGAVWSIGGYLGETNYINAAMTAPKQYYINPNTSNSATGAVLKEISSVSRKTIMFSGYSAWDISLTCDTSYMLKAGVEYAWAAFIPKELSE